MSRASRRKRFPFPTSPTYGKSEGHTQVVAAYFVGQSAVIDPEEPFDVRRNRGQISEALRTLKFTTIEGPLSPAADIHAAALSE